MPIWLVISILAIDIELSLAEEKPVLALEMYVGVMAYTPPASLFYIIHCGYHHNKLATPIIMRMHTCMRNHPFYPVLTPVLSLLFFIP